MTRTIGGDGKNVIIIPRYAHGDSARFPALLSELIALNVDVLFVAHTAIPAAMESFAGPLRGQLTPHPPASWQNHRRVCVLHGAGHRSWEGICGGRRTA